jgi:drug/metabolite transporter (DMT)-like permease
VRLRLAAAYLTCCLAWGSTWLAVAVGLRDLPPLLFAGTRMALAGALLLPLALRGGGFPRGRGLVRLLGLGLLQITLPYGLLFVAQQWTPSGLTAVLFASFPLWVALLARAVLREPLTPLRALAVVLGVGGVAVLQAPALGAVDASPRLALASGLALLASVTAALANVLQKRLAGTWTPVVLTCVQTLGAGAALLLASALLEAGRPAAFTPRALGAIAYLAAVGTVLSYLCLYWLLPRVPLAVVGTIPLVDTTLAVVLGAAVLGEPVGWNLLAGGALVLAAAALASRPAGAQPSTVKRGASAQSPSRS